MGSENTFLVTFCDPDWDLRGVILIKDQCVAYNYGSTKKQKSIRATWIGSYTTHDYVQTDYGKPDYEKPEYGKPDYGNPDYTTTDYTTSDHNEAEWWQYVVGTVVLIVIVGSIAA